MRLVVRVEALRAEWAFESVTARVLHLNSRAQQIFFRCSAGSSEQGRDRGLNGNCFTGFT